MAQKLLSAVAVVVAAVMIGTVIGLILSAPPPKGEPPAAPSPTPDGSDAPDAPTGSDGSAAADAGEDGAATSNNGGSAPDAEDVDGNGPADPATSQPAQNDAPSDGSPPRPRIERIELDGQDVADLLDLRMWKFRFRLPENEYTNYVWVERWQRGAETPEVRLLAQTPGIWQSNELVLKLPSPSDRRLFVRVGESVKRAAQAQPISAPSPWRLDVLEEQQLQPDEDVHLLTYTYNDLEPAAGGLSDVHHQHDVTVYVLTRFTSGPFIPFKRMRTSINATPPTQPTDRSEASATDSEPDKTAPAEAGAESEATAAETPSSEGAGGNADNGGNGEPPAAESGGEAAGEADGNDTSGSSASP